MEKYYEAYEHAKDYDLIHAVGTNLNDLTNYANERNLKVKEITKRDYMWSCITFRSEQIFE